MSMPCVSTKPKAARKSAFAGMTIRVVHAMSDPHARMGWEHGGPGGLGTIPIGATERWLKQERQAVQRKVWILTTTLNVE